MIRAQTFFACLALLFLPAIVSAQTAFYGTLSCDDARAQSAAAASANKNGQPGEAASGKAEGQRAAGQHKGPGSKAKSQAQSAAIADNKADPAPGGFVEECSWTLPLQIGNDTARDTENIFHPSAAAGQGNDAGTQTIHMTNSEQVTMSLTGSTVLDSDGTARSRQGTWTFTNGTGTLKGVTGTGTYSGEARAAGGMSYDIEGEYEFPAPPSAAPAGSSAPGAPPAPSTSPKAVS